MPRVAGADQTQYAKTNKFFDKLFITENIEAILNRNRAGEQGGKGIAMVSDAKTQKQHVLGSMKLAFEPMGQHPLRDILPEDWTPQSPVCCLLPDDLLERIANELQSGVI